MKRLFHGTNFSVIECICAKNFDWRLHGSVTGRKYGRGSYFAVDAAKALCHSQPDSGKRKYLFVAKVIVGTVVKGHSTMVRPPRNQETGQLYDSTVDDDIRPTIIVKYDKQEYYPEYLLTFEENELSAEAPTAQGQFASCRLYVNTLTLMPGE